MGLLHADPSGRRMRALSIARRMVLFAYALIGPVALWTLASASPPDPSWIAGIYDDADGDDVVTLVVSAAGQSAPAAPTVVGPVWVPAAHLPEPAEVSSLGVAASGLHTRAPPAS